MNANFEKALSLWHDLARWHGLDTVDLLSLADNQDFDESPLWDANPDLALEISDMLDVESLLALGGCLDGGNL